MIELLQRLGFTPRHCTWELTLTCNLQCLHCGSHAGASRDDELSYEQCLEVADQLAAMGCERVTLGGGEPTLHPHWHEIGARLTARGVHVNVLTNGWVWSRDHLQKARDAKLHNVGFSLDGLEEAHDAVRRKDSFRRVVAAIELCLGDGMPVSVVTHINNLNKRQLRPMRDALGQLGVAAWQLQLGIPSGTMQLHPELVIAPEELLWLLPEIAALRTDEVAAPRMWMADNIGYFGKHEQGLRDYTHTDGTWLGCRAGCAAIGIESNGNVKGCLSLPSARHGADVFVEGNLRQQSLAQLWDRPGAFPLHRTFDERVLGGFCAHCRYRDICRGGCGWTAYSHTSNRFDNPYCFYRQAVEHRRFDLLDEAPTAEELAATEKAGRQPSGTGRVGTDPT